MPTLYQIQFSTGLKSILDIYMFNGNINMKQKSTLDLMLVPKWYEIFGKYLIPIIAKYEKKFTHEIECVIPT
jgi:hypothetical protein